MAFWNFSIWIYDTNQATTFLYINSKLLFDLFEGIIGSTFHNKLNHWITHQQLYVSRRESKVYSKSFTNSFPNCVSQKVCLFIVLRAVRIIAEQFNQTFCLFILFLLKDIKINTTVPKQNDDLLVEISWGKSTESYDIKVHRYIYVNHFKFYHTFSQRKNDIRIREISLFLIFNCNYDSFGSSTSDLSSCCS